jgi:hypothetical protein
LAQQASRRLLPSPSLLLSSLSSHSPKRRAPTASPHPQRPPEAAPRHPHQPLPRPDTVSRDPARTQARRPALQKPTGRAARPGTPRRPDAPPCTTPRPQPRHPEQRQDARRPCPTDRSVTPARGTDVEQPKRPHCPFFIACNGALLRPFLPHYSMNRCH